MIKIGNVYAANYVVKIGKKVLHLDMDLKSQLLSSDKMPAKEVNAVFVKKNWTIYYNQQWIEKAQLLDILHIGFRQVRHVYQTMQVIYNENKSPLHYKEPLEKVVLWKDELENKSKDLINFLTLDINIDAYAFANYMMKKMFNTDYYIPEEIRDKVIVRMEEIEEILMKK